MLTKPTINQKYASQFSVTLTCNSQAMDTLPPKPNLVVRGEMPEIVAKKVGDLLIKS